jgi:general stress protein 26
MIWYAHCFHSAVRPAPVNPGIFSPLNHPKENNMNNLFTLEAEPLVSAEIKQQIQELGTALFLTENESLLKLPVHVINHVQVDDREQIWFLIPKPKQAITEFDESMPAKLDFFKKGINFYIKVKGIASIVDNAAKIRTLMYGSDGTPQNDDHKELVAVKVKIQSIDHFETTPKPSSAWHSRLPLVNLFSNRKN